MSKRDGKLDAAAAGLPGAPEPAENDLRDAGIDPDRLSIAYFGRPAALLKYPYPPWARRMALGIGLWVLPYPLGLLGMELHGWSAALLSLLTGLIILQAACDALITGTERLAARLKWAHYIAGTMAEILSTVPELVAIAFVVPVSPLAAFVIALITIYNNALVFSLYSYFLPKDKQGKFLMPKPVTEAGTQILIAGAALGLTLGLVLLAMSIGEHRKTSFNALDLTTISVILLVIFSVYIYKLVANYAGEEEEVYEALSLSEQAIDRRRTLVYKNVKKSPPAVIVSLFVVGVMGAFLGGERVAGFAQSAIEDLGFNHVLTALILAVFAGMSEYVILWKSHRKKEYGIALANAFGGITQVMYLVLPFTLLSIAMYQAFVNPEHEDFPIGFTLSNILLLTFLAPTFFVLAELIEEDHTLSILDATIMTAIFLLLLILLVTYGADSSAVTLQTP